MRDLQTLIGIFICALILNAIWERLQMPLYSVDVSGWDCWTLCLKASVWDASIITGVYLLVDTPHRTTRYVLSALICLLIAIFIEQRALVEGRWVYAESMPTLWGIGLSPLVQLPLLAIATYELIRKLSKV